MKRTASILWGWVVTAGIPLVSSATLVPINQLDLVTPTRVQNVTGQINNAVFSDATVDGDTNVASTADFAFAWEMTFLTTTSGASRSSLIDLGGGGNGLSVTWVGNQVFVQTQDLATGTQLGGNGGAGSDTGALAYTLTAGDLNVERTWAVSIDVDPTASTLNLFVDEALIGSVTAGSVADWAGGDNGSFWGRAGTVLLDTHGSGSGAFEPTGAEATVNTTTGLRFYEDTVLVAVPEPGTLALGLAGWLFVHVLRRR